MNVSVIIPAINEAPGISRAIRHARQSGACEVIVVDGGSDDSTADVARAEGCRVIQSRTGRAIQMNAGAARATGDVLLFQHADAWLAPEAIGQIQRALAERPGALGGAFRQAIDAPGWRFRWLEWGNARRVRWFGAAYGDQGIFVKKPVFDQLGGFPEIELMEDVAFMRRLRRRAWPLLLPGPVHVDARRWLRYGVVRQTLRNWTLVALFRCGMSPSRLARLYRRHDQS